MPKLSEILFGKKDKTKRLSTLTPLQEEMMKIISEGLVGGGGPFAELFGPFNKEAFAEGVQKPAMQHFQDVVLPQLQEKFIAGNQVLGSGLRRGQLDAAKKFEGDLAALMYQAQQDQQKNKIAGIQSVLGTKGQENIYKQGSTGAVPGFLQGIGQGIGKAAGAAVAG